MINLVPLMLATALHSTGAAPVPTGHAWMQPRRVFLQDLPELARKTSRQWLVPTAVIGVAHVPSLVWALTFSVLEATGTINRLPFATQRRQFWEFNNWKEPTFSNWARHLTSPPKWPDGDEFLVNYIIHPWVGMQIQMTYRNHGASVWQAIAMVVVWAFFWEFVAESGFEHPSGNDLLANFAGGLAGEAAFRAKMLLRTQMHPGIARNVLVTLLDPFGALELALLDAAEDHAGAGPVVRWLR